jgi:hypothetical protein
MPADCERQVTDKNVPTIDEELDQIKAADWKGIAAEGLDVLSAAAAATGKEHTMTSKIIAFLKHIKDNTGIDEALLEFSRCFLLVSISCALGLGVPLLQIDGPNMSIVLSAGLASGLQVLVKYLDPKQTAFGIKETK